MKRRTVLKRATAAAGTIVAAGCLSEGSPGGGGESDETTAETTAPESTTSGDGSGMAPSVSSRSVETTETGCGSENAASVSFTDGGVSVDGDVPASDPCHEAAFGEVAVEDGALSVTMEVTGTDADACQQCLGQVTYAAGVEVDGGELSSVTVRHRSQGETTTVAEASP